LQFFNFFTGCHCPRFPFFAIFLSGISTVLRGLKKNKPPAADCEVNEFFFIYGGIEVRDNLSKIMITIFEKGEVPSDFRKALINPLHKEGGMSECGNYFVRSKSLSIVILVRLRDIVD